MSAACLQVHIGPAQQPSVHAGCSSGGSSLTGTGAAGVLCIPETQSCKPKRLFFSLERRTTQSQVLIRGKMIRSVSLQRSGAMVAIKGGFQVQRVCPALPVFWSQAEVWQGPWVPKELASGPKLFDSAISHTHLILQQEDGKEQLLQSAAGPKQILNTLK